LPAPRNLPDTRAVAGDILIRDHALPEGDERAVDYRDLVGNFGPQINLHMFQLRPHTHLYRIPVVKRQ
jgi:hypothetical protein